MRFAYLALPSGRPIPSLRGSQIRHRPIIPVHLIGSTGSRLLGGNLDSGSDDTLFPLHLAARLGVDLTNAVEGEARSVGGPAVRYAYAPALPRVADGSEACEWTAIVGFIAAPLRWAILGHAVSSSSSTCNCSASAAKQCWLPTPPSPGGILSANRPPPDSVGGVSVGR